MHHPTEFPGWQILPIEGAQDPVLAVTSTRIVHAKGGEEGVVFACTRMYRFTLYQILTKSSIATEVYCCGPSPLAHLVLGNPQEPVSLRKLLPWQMLAGRKFAKVHPYIE